MRIIKKLDLYMLKKFILLFVGSFCISLFVLMMQFLWRYLDELIGKGLPADVFIKFFWYMGLSLVADALPLSILLATLICFSNLGEDMELTAMKSAGIPLKRIMAPIFAVCVALGIGSFMFQNNISPNAQKQLKRMLLSMKETSPALEIPEGVFYNGIPNINLYVQKKEVKTGMLYDMIIYKMDQGFENAQIVVADSGKLETTADKHFLQLTIFSGELFENLRSTTMNINANINVPYDRETFKEKKLLMDYDGDFSMQDENMFSTLAEAKNLSELTKGADSIKQVYDSIGKSYEDNYWDIFLRQEVSKRDSVKAKNLAKNTKIDIQDLYENLSMDKKLSVIQEMQKETMREKEDLEWQEPISEAGYKNVRRHQIEWHKKFAYSLACIIFLLIGAPLGAIIRKGGLGMPTVISVIIFIIYYIINTSGMKQAREDSIAIWLGLWMSTFVLAPFGLWITNKANNDSVAFNMNNVTNRIMRFFGVRKSRMYNTKDVIIEEPDYSAEAIHLQNISNMCAEYIKEAHLPHIPNYFKLYFGQDVDNKVEEISQELEDTLSRLANSRNARLLTYMSQYPELYTKSHLSPFSKRGINIAIGILFPLGIVIGWRIWRFRIRLYQDMKTIIKTTEMCLTEMGNEMNLNQEQTAVQTEDSITNNENEGIEIK